MSIVYRNARLFIDDVDISAVLTELAVEVSVEMLDATTMGKTYRVKAGGLQSARLTGKALIDTAPQPIRLPEAALFSELGEEASVLVFADGIVPGSLSARGFAMRGVISEMKFGGAVGSLLTLDFTIEGRGIYGS